MSEGGGSRAEQEVHCESALSAVTQNPIVVSVTAGILDIPRI